MITNTLFAHKSFYSIELKRRLSTSETNDVFSLLLSTKIIQSACKNYNQAIVHDVNNNIGRKLEGRLLPSQNPTCDKLLVEAWEDSDPTLASLWPIPAYS